MGFVYHMLFYAVYLALIKLLNNLQEAQLYKNETCQEKHFKKNVQICYTSGIAL